MTDNSGRAPRTEDAMKTQKTRAALNRRNFLGAVGGASAVAGAASPIASTEAQAYNPGHDETKARYRETDHVKAFYRTNGYETLKK